MKTFANPIPQVPPQREPLTPGKVLCPPAQMYRAWLRPCLAASLLLFASCSLKLQAYKTYTLPDGSKLSAASHVTTIYKGGRLVTIHESGEVFIDTTAAPIAKGGAQ